MSNADPNKAPWEEYRELLALWKSENPIKTTKLQVLLAVNAGLVSVIQIKGGFTAVNWPVYLAGAFFSLIWTVSMARTSLFQKVWQMKLRDLAERHKGDSRFQITVTREFIKRAPKPLQFLGGISSKYYLLGAPVVLSVAWIVGLVYVLNSIVP